MPPTPAIPAHLWPSPPARATRVVASLVLFTAATGIAALGVSRAYDRAVPTAEIATRINLNTASAAELDLLPRIGPALAARIVEDRERHGDFSSIEALDRVRGVGPQTIQNLRPYLVTEESDHPR